MVAAGTRGTIINIASIMGLRVRPQVAAYAATKAAVVQLTKALALEWAEHGIRVNAIAPGYFETDLTRDLLRSPVGQAIVARIPQQRVGQLAELDGNACVPLTFQNLVKGIFGLGGPDAAVVSKATEAFNKEASVLDQHLAKHDWLVGSAPTLADFTVSSYLFYANEAKLPVAAYKNVTRWFERLSALPCWAETAPPPRPAVAA